MTEDSSVNTGGGAFVAGSLNIDGGSEFVGRDKIVGYTVDQVQTLLTQISSTFQPKPFDGRCPYVGLDAFSEDDADRFFGRETLIAELIERVKAARFLVIAGPSGSGKSSVVRAGLVHQLKQCGLPNSDRWLYATLTPGREPIESLALAVARMAKDPNAGEYLREQASDATALHKSVEALLSDLKDQRALIFVDQFEEVFTQVSKESDRVAFLNLLTTAATIEGGRITVLFTMRSDFVANCATYPQLNTLLNQQFLQVGAMQPAELVSAIARPALEVGVRIDPDLVKQIVDGMGDEPGALPLMQFALKDLFDADQAKGGVIALTLDDYLSRGGLRKALERHADAAFGQLSPIEQQLARSIFAGLIEIGSGRADTRRTASFDELVPASATVDPVKAVIQKLADARLITTSEHDHKESVTISHERLIEAWPWLRKLINENRESIALQNEIAGDAQEWDHNQRDASYLYTGARLATAREKLTAKKIVLNELAQAFVEAGIQAERNELEEVKRRAAQLRRQAIYLIGALGLAVLLGIIAGLFGVQSNQSASSNATLAAQNASIASTAQAASTLAVSEANIRATAEINANLQRDEAQRQAAIADSRRLASATLNNLVLDFADPDYPVRILALNLARAAVDRARTVEAENALRTALRLSMPVFTMGEFTSGALRDLQFSPDSRRVAMIQTEGAQNAWVVDLDSNKLTARITLSADLNSLIFTPDSQGVATIGTDNMLRIWDINTFQARERFKWGDGEAGATSLVYSPDGRRLLIIGDDLVARVLNADDGQLIATGPRLDAHVFQAVFSADGNRIMTVAGGDDVRLWDATTGSTVAEVVSPNSSSNGTADVGTVIAAYLSPDGERVLIITSEGVLLQWTATARQVTVLHDLGISVQTATFSNDGLRLGILSVNQSLSIYAIDTGQLFNLAKPTLPVFHLSFSPDSQRLLTFGFRAQLWDALNGAELVEVDGIHAFASGSAARVDAAFSPDSQLIALYGEGYIYPPMRFEPVYLDGLLNWSRRLAPKKLTCEQQVQYQLATGVCPTPTPAP
jgi:hypothetical protein